MESQPQIQEEEKVDPFEKQYFDSQKCKEVTAIIEQFVQDEKIICSVFVEKELNFMYDQKRTLLVTNKYVYNIDKSEKSADKIIKRKIEVERLQALT